MVARNELLTYCNELLNVNHFKDYCPNGLQVEGAREVSSVVAGVTACEALLDAAIERNADTVLVHHGYFWRGEDERIVGMKRARLAKLIAHDINLIAYHLPLDVHREYGNNVGLGRALDFDRPTPLELGDVPGLLWHSQLDRPIEPHDLSTRIAERLNRAPQQVVAGDRPVERVVWCTGGAQQYIELAADFGANAYISGEISEQTTHIARERGIHYFAAGHHATERFGAQALLQHLLERYSLDGEFVDIDNPA